MRSLSGSIPSGSNGSGWGPRGDTVYLTTLHTPMSALAFGVPPTPHHIESSVYDAVVSWEDWAATEGDARSERELADERRCDRAMPNWDVESTSTYRGAMTQLGP